MPDDSGGIYRALVAQSIEDSGMDVLPEDVLGKFATFLDLLVRWNERLNLSAVREPSMMVQRHFMESVFAAQHVPPDTATLLDYGSGGGFPGIPIALCRPEIQVTLAESQNKKASFLREATRVLEIDTEVIDRRVETMTPERMFDVVTMRAVERMERAIPIAAAHTTRSLMMLVTVKTASTYGSLAPGFAWAAPLPLPASQQRVLLQGKRT